MITSPGNGTQPALGHPAVLTSQPHTCRCALGLGNPGFLRAGFGFSCWPQAGAEPVPSSWPSAARLLFAAPIPKMLDAPHSSHGSQRKTCRQPGTARSSWGWERSWQHFSRNTGALPGPRPHTSVVLTEKNYVAGHGCHCFLRHMGEQLW